jgi:hypothetical protein
LLQWGFNPRTGRGESVGAIPGLLTCMIFEPGRKDRI